MVDADTGGMDTYVVHIRKYSEKGHKRPLARGAFGPTDKALTVDAEPDKVEKKALARRADWYVVATAPIKQARKWARADHPYWTRVLDKVAA